MAHHIVRVLSILAAVAGLAGGCSGLNPALLNTAFTSPVSNLDSPTGAILIVVMNYTVSDSLTRLDLTKDNGGVVQLAIPATPFSPTSLLDHAVAVQDCDIAQVDFRDVQLRVTGVTTAPPPISFSRPPLIAGQSLYCGDVIAITIGQPGEVQPSSIGVAVY